MVQSSPSVDSLGLIDLVWALPAAGVVAGAIAFGLWCLDRLNLRFNVPLDFAFAGTLGLMALSLATFGLSLARFMPRWVFFALPAAMLVFAFRSQPRDLGRPRLAVALVVLIFLTTALGSVTLPPADYDDLSYHLVTPKEYFRAGGYVRLDDWNVCTAFPQNVEMLTLHGMGMTGSVARGVVVGRLYNVALMLFLALGVYGGALRVVTPGLASIAAGLTVLLEGWRVLAGLKTATEPAQAVCGWLAGAALLWIVTGAGSARTAFLGGLMAGFSAGAKYPMVAFCAVPLFVLLLAFREIRGAAAFGAGALLAFAPWAIRGIVENGNPVFPLAASIFPSPNWTPLQAARLARFSGPGSFAYLWSILPDAIAKFELNPLLLVLPLGACRASKRAGPLLGGAALAYAAVWLLFTHRYLRFLMPIYPYLAVLSVMTLHKPLPRLAVGGVAVACVVLAVPMLLTGFVSYQGRALHTDADFRSPDLAALERVNALPRRGSVLMVGEGRTFRATRPFIAAHAFNRHPFLELVEQGATPDDLKRWLAERDVAYILINGSEYRRIQEGYTFVYEGRTVPGFTEKLTPELPAALGWREVFREAETVVYELGAP